MSIAWLVQLRKHLYGSRARRRTVRPKPRRVRLQLEQLETRVVPVLSPAPNANPVASSFVPAVGEVKGTNVFTNQPYIGTGTLIADRWVLTADHVVSPSNTQDLQFLVNGTTYTADARYGLNPLILGTAYPDYQNYEIGLIHLSQSVPGVTPVPIWRGEISAGQKLIIAGYGETDNGTHTEQPNTANVRRAGYLYVDSLPSTNEGDQTLLETTYGQDPNGAFSGHGDSGGPLLLYTGGRYYVAGVVSHFTSGYITANGNTYATTGTVADALNVAQFGEWIDNVIRTSSVSERFAVSPGGPQAAGIQDVTPPVIRPIQDIFVQATGGGAYVNFPTPQVSDDYDINPSVVFAQPSGTTLFSQSGAAFPVGTTTVTVTATDASGNRATTQFNVVVTGPPTPLTPFLDQPVPSTTPTFTWSAVSGATSYSVSVLDAQTQQVVASAASLTGTSWTPSTPLVDGLAYQWQVTAYTPLNGALVASKPSNPVRFFVNVTGALILTSPAPGATVTTSTPTLQWTPNPGSFSFKLNLFDLTAGTPVINTNGWTLVNPSYQLTVPLPSGHTYLWTVTGNDTNHTSATAEFTVAVPGATGSLAAPTLSGPSGLLSTATPTFQWSAVPGATGYGLYIFYASTTATSWALPIQVSGTSYTPGKALDEGRAFLWYVTAYDGAGNVSPPPPPLDFGVGAPAKFTGTAGAGGPSGTINTPTPTFTWSAVSGAQGYYLSVVDETLHTPAFSRFGSGTSFTLGTGGSPSLVNGHSYRWYVSAQDINGVGAATTQSFTAAFPVTPTPQSAGGLQPTTTPTFQWSASPGATGYYLTLTDQTTGRTLLDSQPVTVTSYTLGAPLSTSDTYQWQVSAYDGAGDVSAASAPVSFTVAVNLAAPTLTPLASPVPTAAPTLQWSAVANAAGYNVHVVDTTTNSETVVEVAAPTTAYTVPPLADGHSYRWWVVAYDSAGNLGPAPAALTFTVQPPPTPTSLAPGGVVAGTPTLQWSASAGAAGYVVQLFDVTAAEPIYVAGSASASGTSYTPDTSLVDGHLYQWRVRAVDGAGNTSSWSSTLQFTAGADESQSMLRAGATRLAVGDRTTITLTARDADGNQETAGGLVVAFGLGSGGGQGTFGPVQDNGDGTYSVTFTATAAGSITLTATIDGQAVTTTAPTVSLVGPVSLGQSTVTLSTSTLTAGASATVTLTARDAQGTQEPHGGLVVVFGLGGGTGRGTFGAVQDNGDGTYTATFTATTAGPNTITATVGGQAVTSTAPGFTVVPGPVSLSQSTVVVTPATVAAGAAATVTLTAQDAQGNQEASGGLTVTFALGSGSGRGTLGAVGDHGDGTYTATFTATTAGSVTLTAAIGGQAVTGTLPTVVVTPGAASRLVFTVPPASAAVGQTLDAPGGVQVAVQDAFGNVVTGDSSAVTVALGANPGGAHLGGSLGVAAVHGVATFADLTVDAPGSGYTLTAGDGGLTPATSAPFAVTVSADLAVSLAGPGSAAAGDAGGFTYAITVSNLGPGANAGFTVSDPLPAGLTFDPAQSSPGCTAVGQVVTCSSTGLAAGAAQVFLLHVLVGANTTAGSVLQDQAAISGSSTADTNSTNNTSATVATTVLPAPAQGFARQGGASNFSEATATAVDAAGNVYVAGYYLGTVLGLTSSSAVEDGFVAKYDATGKLLWARDLGLNPGAPYGSARVTALALDAAGNVYVTGKFYGTVRFGNTTPLVWNGSEDNAFAARLNADGTFAWAEAFGVGATDAEANGIAVDAAGDVYVSGMYSGTGNFNPQGTKALTASNAPYNFNVFAVKLNAGGTFSWAESLGGGSYAFGEGIGADAQGDVYLTGELMGVGNFSPTGLLPIASGDNGQDQNPFVAKLAPSGNPLWVDVLGAGGESIGVGLAVDAAGNVYTTGEFSGGGNFDPHGTYYLPWSASGGSARNAYVSELDANGNFVWAKALGGGSQDTYGIAVAVDGTGKVTVAGEYSGTGNFNPDGGTTLSSSGGYNAFVTQLDAAGHFAWAKSVGAGAQAYGEAVAVAGTGAVDVAGSFQGTGNFDPGSGVTSLSSPASNKDAFLVQIAPPQPAHTATHLVLSAQPPAQAVAGAGFGVVALAEDDQSNLDRAFSGSVTVSLAANPGKGTLGGTLTVSASNGVADFSGLSVDQAATGYTLRLSSGSLAPATTTSFGVSPGSATQVVVTTPPAGSVTAGAGFGLTVSAEDAFGNVDPTYGSGVTVALAANPGGATLGGSLTVLASAGVATFTGLSLDRAGTGYTLRLSSGSLTPATTNAIRVTPGSATQLVVTTQPTSVTAGAGFGLVVQAEDAFGNVDPTFAGIMTVALAANPGSASLGGSRTASIGGGVATFSGLTLDRAAAGYTLQVSAGSLSATTSAITAVAGSATHLVVTTPPAGSVTAGAGFGLVVQAEDAFGNVDLTYGGGVTVALASNPGNGTLGGSLTIAAANGVATFSGLSLDRAAAGYTLRLSSGSLTAATTNPVTVTAAPGTQLVVTAEPSGSVRATIPFGLVVQAEDPFGNLDPTFGGGVNVILQANPGHAVLGGTTTVSAVNGVATFADLTLDAVGTGYVLRASAAGLSAASGSAFNVTPRDNIPPTSRVAALPAFSPGTFPVGWSGQDDPGGSGLASYRVYVSDDGGPFTLWQPATTQTSAAYTGQDGHTYAFNSIATDNAGNAQPTPAAPQAITTVDAAPPGSSVAALPAFSPAGFTVSWSGADSPGGSGLASFNVYVSDNNGPFTLWQPTTTRTSATYTGQDGHTYAFYSVATDNVGNRQATPTTAQALTTVDGLPPTGTVAALPGFAPGSFTLHWSGSDSGSGVATYDVFVSDNGGAYTAFRTATAQTSATFSGLTGHTYRFYTVATDNVGNVQPTPASAQAATVVDAVAPSSTVTALPAFSPADFTLHWSGSDNAGGAGLATFDVFVSDNGGPFVPLVTGTTQTSTPFAGSDGHSYRFYSVATDNVGNRETPPTAAQAGTRVDAAAPTSTVAALPNFSPATFTVRWSGGDGTGSGVATFNVLVSDNGGPFTTFRTDTTQTSASFTGQSGHTYVFYSLATDNAGNVQPTLTTIPATTVDAVAPTSSVVALQATTSTPTFTVSWSGSDNPGGSGIATYDVYVSDNGGAFTPFLTGTPLTSANFTGQYGHSYGFFSVAADGVGNRQATPPAAQAATAVQAPPRPIAAFVFTFPVGKQKLTAVEVDYADTGAIKSVFVSPFQKPKYQNIRVSVLNGTSDQPQIVVTAVKIVLRGGKRRKVTVTQVFPG
jgi:uncharacterized repeat protein (TIGR01451 family)